MPETPGGDSIGGICMQSLGEGSGGSFSLYLSTLVSSGQLCKENDHK